MAEVQPLVGEKIAHRRDHIEERHVARADEKQHDTHGRCHGTEKKEQHDRRKEHHLEIAGALVRHRLVRVIAVVLARVTFEQERKALAPVVHGALVPSVLDEVGKEERDRYGKKLERGRCFHLRRRERDDTERAQARESKMQDARVVGPDVLVSVRAAKGGNAKRVGTISCHR